MEDVIKNVLIIVAMRAEADPIIKTLSLQADAESTIPTPTTTRTYSGKVGQIQVHVAHNGKCEKFEVDKVGTNAATLTTYLAIQAFKPDLVISAGTAGGFKARGAEIADVFVSTAVQNHDRRIPLPGFDKFGVGSEDPHPAERIVQELGLKSGVVSTGNSLGFVSEDLELMHSANTAVKDMESAAVAYVCRLWQTPMLAIKAVTDIVDGDKATTEEFLANLQKSSAALQDVVCKVLQFMQGKRLVDL